MTRYSNAFGAFEIDSLPGQSQVAVCHAFMVPENMRGQGRSHELKSLQEIELDILYYDFAICTVATANLRQKAVLKKAGWRYLASFKNRRLAEITELWCRGSLPEEPPCAD